MCGTCGTHRHRELPSDEGRRIVIAGKGGVGKSVLAAVLARLMGRSGVRVVAIDADEQRNLGATLGLGAAELTAVTPLSAAADYIEEKTGARPGEGGGGMLRLNPDTRDVAARLGVDGPDGVRLLVMGGVARAGGGCLCPENALLAAVVAGMGLRHGETVVMDTHAGVEHFGRALARGFDAAVVVVEPTFNSVQVALDTARLADELGIAEIHLVVNRVSAEADLERVARHLDQLGGFPFASSHALPYEPCLVDSEPSVEAALPASPLANAVLHVAGHLGLLRDGEVDAPCVRS